MRRRARFVSVRQDPLPARARWVSETPPSRLTFGVVEHAASSRPFVVLLAAVLVPAGYFGGLGLLFGLVRIPGVGLGHMPRLELSIFGFLRHVASRRDGRSVGKTKLDHAYRTPAHAAALYGSAHNGKTCANPREARGARVRLRGAPIPRDRHGTLAALPAYSTSTCQSTTRAD